MNIYAIIILSLYGGSLLMAANAHGKPREGKSNFWTAAISATVIIYLMYKAGTFN